MPGTVEAAPQEAVLQLIVGVTNELSVEGLGDVAGVAALDVKGIGLAVPVSQWNNTGVALGVPAMGLQEPTLAQLVLIDANKQPIANVTVELVTPEMARLNLEQTALDALLN